MGLISKCFSLILRRKRWFQMKKCNEHLTDQNGREKNPKLGRHKLNIDDSSRDHPGVPMSPPGGVGVGVCV